ncbi:MAG TPA: hypothetical protein DDX06_13630 [Curvibacter sp.]|nr:hypothetical protein [Curvibacter sp.]
MLLAGCSHGPRVAETSESAGAFAGWQHWTLPGKTATDYRPVRYGGTHDAMEAQARASASLLRRALDLDPQEIGDIRFSWKVPMLVPAADMARRETEDAVVRIVLTFDGDRARLSARDRALSELAQLMTGEPLPYATLMYVWCPTRVPGSVILNPRTDRIRKLVVESGPARLNQWLDYERDIRADFLEVFGEEPGRLLHVAIMSDGDNTGSEFRVWYGPVLIDGLDVASQD